jgi:hypothetical protein
MKDKLKLVDRIEGKSYIGSRATIKGLLYRRYREYKYRNILKGVAFIKDTYYIA